MKFLNRFLPKGSGGVGDASPQIPASDALDDMLHRAAQESKRLVSTSKSLTSALSTAYGTSTDNEIGGAHLTTRGLLAGLTDPVIVMDNSSYVIEVYNAAAEVAFGYSASEVIGNSLTLLFKEKYFKKIMRTLHTKSHAPLELSAKTKFGPSIVVEIQSSRYENTTVFVMRDLTARRQAEAREREALRRRNELQSIVDSLTTVGIFITDPSKPDNPIIFANEGVRALTGYNRHEILGKNPRFLQGHDVQQPGLDILRDNLKHHTPVQGIILRNYRKNGTLFYSALSITPIKDAENRIAHWVGTFTDVTDSQHQNSRVSQLGLYLDTILAQSPIGIAIYDYANKEFAFSNAAGKALYAQVLTNPVEDLLTRERLHSEKTVVEPITTTGDDPSSFMATYCVIEPQMILSFFIPMQKRMPEVNGFELAALSLALPVVLYDAGTKTIEYANKASKALGLAVGQNYEDHAIETNAPQFLGMDGVYYTEATLAAVPFICGKCAMTRDGKSLVAVFFLSQLDMLSLLVAKNDVKHTLDALPVSALVFDGDGYVLEANILARTLLGLNVGSRLSYAFDEPSINMLKTSQISNAHMPLTLPGGLSSDCTVIAAPHSSVDGSTLLLLIEGLVPKNDALTRALHASNDAIAVLTPELKLITGNASFFNLYKAKPRNSLEDFVILASQKPLPFDSKSVKMGTPWTGTLATYAKDNEVVTSATTVVPIVNGTSSEVSSVLFIQHKVTVAS